jgi:hypothetical protein
MDDHMAVKYIITLMEEEREQLEAVARGKKGRLKIAAWKVTRAKALLKIDRGEQGPAWTDAKVAEALDVTERSITNWKKTVFERGRRVKKLRRAQIDVKHGFLATPDSLIPAD